MCKVTILAYLPTTFLPETIKRINILAEKDQRKTDSNHQSEIMREAHILIFRQFFPQQYKCGYRPF